MLFPLTKYFSNHLNHILSLDMILSQSQLRWSKLIVGWKTLEITLGMFSESDWLLQFYSVFSLLSKSLIK